MLQTLKIGTLRWLHIQDPSDEDLEFLKDNFHFHPLDIEDCKSRNQRPKIDVYDDYYFLILHFPNYDRFKRLLKTKEVKIFWGEDYIITIGKSHWVVSSLFDNVMQHNDPYELLQAGTSDSLLYKIIERLMHETYQLISKMGIELDLINRELFSKNADKTIERISVTRRNMIQLNTIFKPQIRLFQGFESGHIEGFAENMEDYWGNILDYYQKMWDMIEDYEELIEGLSKTFDSLQTNRTNEIMKALTLISSILLPLTFVASLYGMNVNLPFAGLKNSFWLLLSIMLFISIAFILLFKRKRWM
ncbi:MAG: magnesium transporter CorA family protein [Bacteroidales bacterium]|jgi:magnesium transporter